MQPDARAGVPPPDALPGRRQGRAGCCSRRRGWRCASSPRATSTICCGSIRIRASCATSRAAGRRRPTRSPPRSGGSSNYGRVNYGLGIFRASRRDAGAATVRGDAGAFIGWGCLKYTPPTCDVEVGYRLLHEAWGQGYATEIATALVRYGFGTLTLDRIIGVTHPGNTASQRVLLKSGLADAGWGRYYGKRLRLFAQDRATWLAAHP